MADITFNLQVLADTTPVRNRTVDELCSAIRFYQRESLLRNGIQLMRLSMGEETDYPLNASEKIFVANLNCVVNAELYFDNKVASITKVNYYGFVKGGLKNPDMDAAILQDGQNAPDPIPDDVPFIPPIL